MRFRLCGVLPVRIEQINSRFRYPAKATQQHREPADIRPAYESSKPQRGYQDQNPQDHQPEEGEQIPFQIEKRDRPQKIECQLNAIGPKAHASFPPVVHRYGYQIRSNAHQYIQHRPYGNSHPGGDRAVGSSLKRFHAVHGQKSCRPAYHQGNGKADNEPFFIDFHAFHLLCTCMCARTILFFANKKARRQALPRTSSRRKSQPATFLSARTYFPCRKYRRSMHRTCAVPHLAHVSRPLWT